jgi:hypothetical protein
VNHSNKMIVAAASIMPLIALAGGARPALADEQMVLVDKIDVGGNGLGAFDISYVDSRRGLYVLSDRTNASVDFIDPRNNTFLGRVAGFKGVVLVNGVANNNLSGPDGVTIVGGKEVWAGDGDSTVKVIDIATQKIVDTISTGGQFRCDEMSWDSADHILAVANNADTPPYLSLIDTDTHQVLKKIVFDGSNGTPNATNGLEQSQWSRATGMFYVSVPQVGTTDVAQGGVAVIDPSSQSVTATYPVSDCTPAGLTLGPDKQALFGCSASFGTAPNVLTQSVVIDITSGAIRATIPQVGGSDEVWYDAGTNHYYLAARSNQDNNGVTKPVLGVVDASSNTFDTSVPTSTSAHSVAADKKSHHVFVPIGFVAAGASDPTNPCPTKGCIAVYLPSSPDQDDHGQGDNTQTARKD